MIENMQKTHFPFMSEAQNIMKQIEPNVKQTENGALAYRTSGKALVDLNFKLSSMRNMSENEIWSNFLSAYNEDPSLAVLWLFFARDIREGCGERRTFRVIFQRLASENESLAKNLLNLIPEYGRWDDLVWLADKVKSSAVRQKAIDIIHEQITEDIRSCNDNGNVSLLAKWMPSISTSSKETRRLAEMLRSEFKWTPKQYRKNLSGLRRKIGIVEAKMSAKNWGDINYEGVPSKAAMIYRDAFRRHDEDRYDAYLANVKEGKAKINAGVLMPYELVHAYYRNDGWYYALTDFNDTLEQQWKALPNKMKPNESTLVVVDGSGSMDATIGGTSVTCHDVARSLGIYFSEKLTGDFKDSFITFSANPRIVRFDPSISLRSKLELFEQYDECSNTDIEKVFNLILGVALTNRLTQDQLPSNVLIISDMEFDRATYQWDFSLQGARLFDEIKRNFEQAGYKLPRLIFWNVCSRSGAIPINQNENGVSLVSGFSPNICDMIMSANLDPFDVLKTKLLSPRYRPVVEAMSF